MPSGSLDRRGQSRCNDYRWASSGPTGFIRRSGAFVTASVNQENYDVSRLAFERALTLLSRFFSSLLLSLSSPPPGLTSYGRRQTPAAAALTMAGTVEQEIVPATIVVALRQPASNFSLDFSLAPSLPPPLPLSHPLRHSQPRSASCCHVCIHTQDTCCLMTSHTDTQFTTNFSSPFVTRTQTQTCC